MKDQQEYLQDLTEIRSMMERSTKFVSLSGWSGVLAGLYGLSGVIIAHHFFEFDPTQVYYKASETLFGTYLTEIIVLTLVVLLLAFGTAVLLSFRKAKQKSTSIWNVASKRMLTSLGIPLLTGGVLCLLLLNEGLFGLIIPTTLIFYGLALFQAGFYTFKDIRYLGLIQILLGLISVGFIEYSLWLWALGFGIFHIIYGLYIHIKFEKS